MRAPDIPAPRAVASSPSGWAFLCIPAGEAMTGRLTGWPRRVVERERWEMSRRKRGRRVRSSKAVRLRRVVISSMAPASMKSQTGLGRTCLARAS